MITIHGRATSSNVQLAMWAVGELGLEHARIDCGGAFGGLDTEAYGAMNPNRLIPVLVDDGQAVWESAAILRYLAAQYGDDTFWPADPRRRAALDQWAEWGKNSFAPAVNGGVFWPLIRIKAADRDMDALAHAAARAGALAQILDRELAGKAYLGGDALSFADLAAGHILYRYYTLDFARAETPNLDAYYARLSQRPAFQAHVMVSYDALRVE